MNRNGNTLTITGLALGEASITVTSGNAQTTIPIVVADKVLDVPHIRQEESHWCWAACAQMMVECYEPNTTATQTDMARTGQGLDENEDPDNTDAGYTEIKRIIENYTDATAYLKDETEFTENDLVDKLDSGSPVIYLSSRYRPKGSTNYDGGHIRIIYGYYETPNGNAYLVHEPYGPVEYSNFHLDIWQRSWINICDEDEQDPNLNVDRLPAENYRDRDYFANWFIYCS